MGERYTAPKTEVMGDAELLILCQSQPLQSGTVETVERMDFDW